MSDICKTGGQSTGLFFDGNAIRGRDGKDAGFMDGNVIRNNNAQQVGFIHEGVVHDSGGREVGFVRSSLYGTGDYSPGWQNGGW